MTTDIAWGPTGQVVYERTYSRVQPDGSKETWPETVRRVAEGNLALTNGPRATWNDATVDEYRRLVGLIESFRILPAGRHLWATGVPGKQYLMNCWTSGWAQDRASDHYGFAFLRLMEGGGVGANYASRFVQQYGAPRRGLHVHIVCDPAHPDFDEMREAGVLSDQYDAEWAGAFEVQDSREGWHDALVDLIDTYFTDEAVLHDNRVYDVSNVRAKGTRLKTFGGTASGPGPFASMMGNVQGWLNHAWARGLMTPLIAMQVDHAVAECVQSGGVRRSARMSILPWNDPYVFDFIECKRDPSKHWTTNISVEVDNDFFDALNAGDDHAARVHAAVVSGMLTNGEPGYWNSSLSNEGELEPVYATNPCAEITLQPWEACNLGHVNMDAFVNADGTVDEDALRDAHVAITRFLMRATFADITDPKSRAIQDANRRIGVGHLGVQGFLAKLGFSITDVVSNPAKGEWFRWLLQQHYGVVREAARQAAFELRVPEPVKVTTVAPTGSVAKLPGVSEGIHPIYAPFFERRVRFNMANPEQAETVARAEAEGFATEVDGYDATGTTRIVVYPTQDPLVGQVERMLGDAGVVESAADIAFADMLAWQALYQKEWADNAVSFTINVQPDTLSPGYVAERLAEFLPRLKGTTIMVDESRPQAPYTRITREQFEQAAARRVEDAIDLDCATGACPIR